MKFKISSKCSTGTCVEVYIGTDGVIVRDSKNETKSHLFFDKEEWTAFVEGVKLGEFDIK
jgi:hypothetical protein